MSGVHKRSMTSSNLRLSRKRKPVPETERKRALFSCDRCKGRKIKCHRIQNNDLRFDNITPCLQCTKANVSCTTSMPRKKRVFSSVPNVNEHYRCLLSLVQGLFPDVEVTNLEQLIEIGQAFEIKMPAIENDSELNDLNTEEPIKEIANTKDRQISQIKLPKLKHNIKLNSHFEKDRLIMDKFGHTHFIGNFGTASLLNGLCDIIIKKSYNTKNPLTSTRDIRDSSVQTITSENKPIYQYPTHLYNLDNINVEHFPLINIISREGSEVYLNLFFRHVHPFNLMFNQEVFMKTYDIFWQELNRSIEKDNESGPVELRINSAEICSIYMVWILGSRFELANDDKESIDTLNEEKISKLIDIIRLSLSDVVLTPSVEGIRLLALFSVYLSSIKVRESGYCLMELACIQTKSLGLHRKFIVDKFNEEKADVMRRLMWTLVKIESLFSCSFGRATAIPWEEIDIDLPRFDDIKEPDFIFYYTHSIKLTKIIHEILEYKRNSKKEPLSLSSIERALLSKSKLETFWENLPEAWKEYDSLPMNIYKPKLHIQYNYYFITLTLPMFLYVINSQSYIIKNDDPFLLLVVCGIKASFKTAEIIGFEDVQGFFNGTIYYDVFYCYNAIMVLLLTYILIKMSKDEPKPIIDLKNLEERYQINNHEILKSINLIRNIILNNLNAIDGTMKRISDVIETLLNDLGIIPILVKNYNAPKSFIKKETILDDCTSVSATIPGSFQKIKLKKHKSLAKDISVSENNEILASSELPTDIDWLSNETIHTNGLPSVSSVNNNNDNLNNVLSSINLDTDIIEALFGTGYINGGNNENKEFYNEL